MHIYEPTITMRHVHILIYTDADKQAHTAAHIHRHTWMHTLKPCLISQTLHGSIPSPSQGTLSNPFYKHKTQDYPPKEWMNIARK